MIESEDQLTVTKRNYEIGFLVKDENPQVIEDGLQKHNFVITKKGPLVKIRLAYPINKLSQAYFGFFQFEGDVSSLAPLHKVLKFNQDIIRYLLIKIPPVVDGERSAVTEKNKDYKRSSQIRTAPEARFRKPVESTLTNKELEETIEKILK